MVEWKRASEIYEICDGFSIFPDKIIAEDIVQGSIGDCYFMSCLAALAAKPDRIKKLFKTHETNSSGCYVVKLCINGTWQEIVIDDYLPVHPGTKRICFGSSKNSFGRGILWVSLIEKAWAKLNGNFDRIDMGTVDMGFIHLSGVPSIGFKHEEYRAQKEIIWNKLIQAEKSKHIMTAGTSEKEKQREAVMKHGLNANHCYSILSVHDLSSHRPVRILKLRNPWGKCHWTGDWSDDSGLWTDELRNKVG